MNSVRGNRALSGRGGRALLVVGVMGGVTMAAVGVMGRGVKVEVAA